MTKNYTLFLRNLILIKRSLKKPFLTFCAKNGFWGLWEPVSYNLVTENTHLVTFQVHFITCFSTLVTYFQEILGKKKLILEFSSRVTPNF